MLEQLTPDHSLVGELVRAGRLSTEEAEQHPHRSVITRAVGTEPVVEVHTETLPTVPGDLYLICSDGLTDLVRDEQILELIAAAEGDPEAGSPVTRRRGQQRGRDRQHHGRPLRDPRRRPRPTRTRSAADEPDGDTAEHAVEIETSVDTDTPSASAPAAPIHRHGAGAGGRWLALFAILLTIAIAALVIWWSLKR